MKQIKHIVRSFYQFNARRISEQSWSNYEYFKSLLYERILHDLNELGANGTIVYDLGSGSGTFVKYLRANGFFSIGLDFSPTLLRLANNRLDQFVCADAYHIPFREKAGNAATALGLFEYIDDLKPILREINRVLGERGVLILTCRNRDYLFRYISFLFTRFQCKYHSIRSVLAECNENGFHVKFYSSMFSIPFLLSLIPKRIKRYTIKFLVAIEKFLQKMFPYRQMSLYLVCVKK